MNLKNKVCRSCESVFSPRSGVQVFCDGCRKKCQECGGPKGVYGRPGKPCLKCSCKSERQFFRTCTECKAVFSDGNNRTQKCQGCRAKDPRGVCLDCGIAISKDARRCNGCRAKSAVATNTTFGHKYEFDGIKYRSKWEAEFARRLTEYGVEFEYERYCPASKGFPDFYIPAKGLYIEIHPDWHGPKRLPENCILVKTQTHAKAIALNLGLAINPEKAGAVVKSRSRRTLCYDLKACEKLAIYLKRAIAEIDAQELRDLDDMCRAGRLPESISTCGNVGEGGA